MALERVWPKLFSRFWLVLAFGALLSGSAVGQGTSWDSLLSGSQWYVPGDNLLAYITSGTNLSSPTPTALADQTIWQLGTATNGMFGGTSTAELKLGPIVTTSTLTMNGVVTDGGQIRIVFTGSDQPTTVGIGQMRDVSGTTYMEMQMLTGSGTSSYVTHWAYMAPYDGNPGTLPPLEIPTTPISQEWVWMEGTVWKFTDAGLFGVGGEGAFSIETYDNGYFWGTGTGPAGSAAEAFSLIGSATPEGNILFNVLSGTTLTGLAGQITGDATRGTMALRMYDNETGNPGDAALAVVVPEPGAIGLLLLGGAACWTARRTRRNYLAETVGAGDAAGSAGPR